MDFSQAITTSFSNNANLSFAYDGNGFLTVVASYNSSIQGHNVSLKFDPSLVSSHFSGKNSSNLTFVVDPSNNVPAIYYQDYVY